MSIYRKQLPKILEDLEKKMVILVGPRQVGKTWLAKEVLHHFSRTHYLNYDNMHDREIIKNGEFPVGTELVVFDEIHKMRNWKNHIKGIYDTRPEGMRMLLTGSARINAFRKVGDSLAGRYFLHHILPLSLAELVKSEDTEKEIDDTIEKLLTHGGFPEPFLMSTADADRWRMQYAESMIRVDVLDFASVEDLAAMSNIYKILQTKVGSPLSLSGIAEDVHISPKTVRRYVQILEDLYLIFSVRPYTKKVGRAIKKEQKIYFYDTGAVSADGGARFENLVALSLLKQVQHLTDITGHYHTLHYIRNKERHEADFALAKDDELEVLVEAKTSDASPAKGILYFRERLDVPAYQIVRHLRHTELLVKGIRVVRAAEYLKGLAA